MESSEYGGLIEENYETIRQMGSKVFILNYPYAQGTAAQDKLEQANNHIAAVAKDLSASLIDVHAYFESLEDYSTDELFCSDMLHLTQKGYELMGDYVAREIHQYYFDLY